MPKGRNQNNIERGSTSSNGGIASIKPYREIKKKKMKRPLLPSTSPQSWPQLKFIVCSKKNRTYYSS